ncbi:MAG: hypothetical protein MUF71_05545 [Candidatus Kapabacteria bacterium]|nr:hypothetical protein [Candidatus Kapabacteria bacterium]
MKVTLLAFGGDTSLEPFAEWSDNFSFDKPQFRLIMTQDLGNFLPQNMRE